MSRVFLTCLVAIALLFTGSIATIAWVTRELPSDAGSRNTAGEAAAAAISVAPAPPNPAIEPGAAAASDVLDDLGVVPVPQPGGLRSRLAPGKSRPGTLHRVAAEMPRSKRAALGDLRLNLRAGMAGLRKRVAGCPVADASFSLAVESTAGGVRILNATLESPAAADDPGIACVQSALRGQVIPADGIQPGRRWQVPFAVHSSS